MPPACFCAPVRPKQHPTRPPPNPAYFLRNSRTHLVYSGSLSRLLLLLSDVNRDPADVESMLSRLGLHKDIIACSLTRF